MKDYKEKYNAALERMKSWVKGEHPECFSEAQKTAEFIFPELQESEDDRIRKGIIRNLQFLIDKSEGFVKEDLHERIAWLEKQKDYIKLPNSTYTSNKDVIEFADKYSHAVWEKLMDNFKKIENYSIGCNDVSDIVLNAIINTYNWLGKQGEQLTDNIKSNPVWSEEDGEMLTWLCRIIHSQRLNKAITLKEESELGEWIDKWLNHNPQTKQCEHLENYDDEQEKIDWSTITDEDIAKVFSELPTVKIEKDEDDRTRKEIIDFLELPHPQFVGKRDHEKWIAWLEKQGEPKDKGEISDGYHTFNELYQYRMLYNAAFFNMLPKEIVHKSKRHHDGEECFGGGWFVVMANLPTGQISNHYELKDWDLFQIPEKEIADEWDGHTPQEAAERLHKYLLEKQDEQKPILDFKASDWYVSKVDGKIHNMYHSDNKVESKFKVGDWVVKQDGKSFWNRDCVAQITNITDCGEHWLNTGCWVEARDIRLWTINDAKDGDVLADDSCIFIIQKLGDNNTAKTYCILHDDGDFNYNSILYLHFYIDSTKPATKEQRDLLFSKMKDAGYEWRQEEKKLIKMEEPKFKVGDCITNGGADPCYVKSIFGDYYELCLYEGFEYAKPIKDVDYIYHLWTINDADDGDVLMTTKTRNCPFIYRKTDYNNNLAYYYVGIDGNGDLARAYPKKMLHHFGPTSNVIPATKEQRDILFARIKKAGYEWDSEKKELKRIKQNNYPRIVVRQDFNDGEGLYKINLDNLNKEQVDTIEIVVKNFKQCKKLDADVFIEQFK